jgi:hypothetical protein
LLNFYEEWLENDYNPFILFDTNGKIIMLNKEAQYLLSQTTAKEIFALTSIYANISFGFKTTHVDLKFGEFEFYAITVGYKDEENIGIKLYKKSVKRFSILEENIEKTNIYSLLDLCISSASTNRNITFKKEFDPTFPELKIDISGFMKLVGKVYESHTGNGLVKVTLAVKTGEYIKFDNKKYPIFYITINGMTRDAKKEADVKKLAEKVNCVASFSQDQTTLLFPMIY